MTVQTVATASSADTARARIRALIISGDLEPGSRLRERDLSQALNVSRVPVREALQQLEAEGFIDTSPRRGATVKQITLRDVNELFDVRLSLEVLAARLAAQASARGESSSRLRQMMNRAEEATQGHDHTQIPLSNTALHAEIVSMGANSLLECSMKPLLGRMQWLFTLTGNRDPQIACAEHLSLCQAIYDGKADLAAALAFSHVELGRVPSLQCLSGRLPER
ncbi:GntR family transcriptional regulator [Pseudarthrobacter sp. H3Y2-7]|uniref:GntR family transcriptional regulator n=1 Tax=Pseudarthrobacter naphthalenicus TaxID=3031328 RepID=UPI0023B051BA|nr:GntR family transcriptional regulator [Pseudarthrobacter sp. H3Y2-7]MDE8667725.1 GntR family transcriptional regulator [Pseudarthrobacter sp. H3Y2-7]